MDETNLSWRARLAKSNINILSMDPHRVFIEFTYHPKPGIFKWCKTVVENRYPLNQAGDLQEYEDFQELNAQHILDEVLKLRKELEG